MRKISANFVYSPHTGFVRNGILKIDDEGVILDFIDPGNHFREEAGLEHYNGIICPGFVNAHCHIELSHMKGNIPEHTGLDNFIRMVVTGRKFPDQFIRDSIRKADEEMQREGIVAVGDICNTDDSFELKAKSRIYYHSFVEVFNMQNSMAETTFAAGMKLLNMAREEYKLSASLVPHASYTVSEELFRIFREELNDPGNILSIHNQETELENQFIKLRQGKFLELFELLGFEKGDSRPRNLNSLPWLSGVIPANSPLLLVHNVFTTLEDIEASGLDHSKTWFCLCPNSNLYIANVLPGNTLMNHFPGQVCIGTDSLSSNHRLSILEELKTLDENYPETGLNKLLQFATLNGAKMLGIDSFAGSFEPGKKPGINLIEGADLQALRLRRESRVRVL